MINLSMTEAEFQAMAGLIDLGVKSGGLATVKTAASVLAKLEAAVAEANAKAQETTEQKEAA
jgi:hypothetical protein